MPPGVPALPDEPEEGLSKRQEFEQHDSDPACRSCHGSMDPIGFALDNFGPTGQWREHDDYGFAIDASGEIPGLGSFSGPREMIALIQESPEFADCFNGQLFRYMVGRSLTSADECQFEVLEEQVRDGNVALEDMIKAIVRSDAFRATTTGND